VDAFMDMGRTAVNVFGNTVAVKLVQKLGGAGLTDTDLPPPVVSAAAAG
jgi:DAACS family dicarboxylate/amino acid:cation (Na+ or H+) symporter